MESDTPADAYRLPKTPTWIEGLDDILHGGFPQGRTTVLRGGPGSGKSILALEFLYRNARENAKGIFIPFEESCREVRENARTLGWDIEDLEQQGRLFLYGPNIDPKTVVTGEFDLNGLLALIHMKAQQMGATHIVFDALDVLLRFFNTAKAGHNELYALQRWIRSHNYSVVLTIKVMEESTGGFYQFLDYIADCVLFLDQLFDEKFTTRRLRVVKYRGSNYGRQATPFVIGQDGIHPLPTLPSTLPDTMPDEKISTGNSRLDTMLFGGYRRGTCILLTGASGTGKTILASTFVGAACARRERVLFINYEESVPMLELAMSGVGVDLGAARASGLLTIFSELPDAFSYEEHLIKILRLIRRFRPTHLVLDAISACERMGNLKTAYEFMVYLVTFCRNANLSLLMTNQTIGTEHDFEITHFNISSLLDTVISLRYISIGGETNRLLQVVKARGSDHSKQAREYRITSRGIDLPDVYIGEGGVLTGVARQEQEAKQAIAKRRRLAERRHLEKELEARTAAGQIHALQTQADLDALRLRIETLRLEEESLQDGRDQRRKMRGEDASIDRLRQTEGASAAPPEGEPHA